jgi:alkylation response protein AidB-like acyl-CoA dehydrogenase
MNHIAASPGVDDAGLRALCHAFAADAARHDREARFPTVNIERLHAAGLLALTVPKRYGGGGAGLLETSSVLGILAEGCASSTLILAMQLFKQAALHRSEIWSEQVRSRMATEAVQSGALVNALRVEPDLGSPTRGGLPATTIRRRPGGGWTLSGHKIFATGAPGLRWMEVWSRTEDAVPLVGQVLVAGDSQGVRIVETWDHIGMRATCSHDVVFTDVAVPDDHVVMRVPAAWQPDPAQAAWNAAGMAAIYTGIARAAHDWVVDFLRRRVPTGLGRPLAALPRAQEKVGEIEMLLATNARLITSIATEADCGAPPDASESALIKTMAVENANRAVELAASLAGNHAHARSNPIERHIRDIRSGRVQAPQADAAFVTAGRAVLLPEGTA